MFNERRTGQGAGPKGRGSSARGADKKAGSAGRCSAAARSVFGMDKVDYIDYKDAKMLIPFVPERAKILPRRISGVCAMHQRKAADGHRGRGSWPCCPYADRLGRLPWKSFFVNTLKTWAGAARW